MLKYPLIISNPSNYIFDSNSDKLIKKIDRQLFSKYFVWKHKYHIFVHFLEKYFHMTTYLNGIISLL